MIVFPNAKINLGLRVLRKREDGYHDLETAFIPVKIFDALEVLPSTTGFRFVQTGSAPDIPAESNLCVRAYRLLKGITPALPDLRIHLHKAIPSGAGLGGGSADASFLLRMLVHMFRLNVTEKQLASMALQLGSDCPFFLVNRPAVGRGRGEILTDLPLDTGRYFLMLINPGIHVSTALAFGGVTPAIPGTSIEDVLQKPVQAWRDQLLNDFETPVFAQHPGIGELKNWFYQQGALYAAMSGTGSTVFGIFDAEPPAFHPFPVHYQVFRTRF